MYSKSDGQTYQPVYVTAHRILSRTRRVNDVHEHGYQTWLRLRLGELDATGTSPVNRRVKSTREGLRCHKITSRRETNIATTLSEDNAVHYIDINADEWGTSAHIRLRRQIRAIGAQRLYNLFQCVPDLAASTSSDREMMESVLSHIRLSDSQATVSHRYCRPPTSEGTKRRKEEVD